MKIPKSPLFAGVETHDLDSMMSCLSAKERNYKKMNLYSTQETKLPRLAWYWKEPSI
ncbi:MAG: hypothetical protein ACLUTO_07975 [Anaerostipes sp.]